MLIRVKYIDDHFDMVRPDILDQLLDAGKVREFERHDGWVIPGTVSMRRTHRKTYSGPDRRKTQAGEQRQVTP